MQWAPLLRLNRYKTSFPNVSIGNPEYLKTWIPHQVENDKKNGFPVKLGMTKRDKRDDKREWIPDQVGDDRER